MITIQVCFAVPEPVLDFTLTTDSGRLVMRSPGYGPGEFDEVLKIKAELEKSAHVVYVSDLAKAALEDHAAGDQQFTRYRAEESAQFKMFKRRGS